MCEALEKLAQQAEEKRSIETATIMLKKGFDHKTVAECSVISI